MIKSLLNNLRGHPYFCNLGLFKKVKIFESFDPDPENPFSELKKVKSYVVTSLKSIIQKLEKNSRVIICARGDSKTPEQYSEFIDKLPHLFIVGGKAKYFIKKLKNPYKHFMHKGRISDEIKELIGCCNKELRRLSKDHEEVTGEIPKEFVDNLNRETDETKKSKKLILLSLLHNKGNDNYFKPYSPFMSFSYGKRKYSEAKKFALYRKRNIGIIYVYILNKSSQYYLKSEKLTKQLKKYRVSWFPDIHKEVMLLNGMYSSRIIGFFKFKQNRPHKFILNPWFYRKIKDVNYDFSNGVKINQKKFHEFAPKLGYQSWFYHEFGSNQEYVSAINRLDRNPVYKFQNLK